MKEEWYEPSPRAKRRAEAFFATPAGKKRLEQFDDAIHRNIEWRIQHQGYAPPPEYMAEHEKWRAGHPELFTNPHK